MRYSDDIYPANIARCQHIKVNGTLCGSPALNQARRGGAPLAFELPILEDANSIQVALMQVMRLLLTGEIEHRTAALLLYALQTASSNLSRTEFKPRPEEVVIDKSTVADTQLGDKAWYKQEFEDLQNEEEEEEDNEEEGTIQAVACPTTPRKPNSASRLATSNQKLATSNPHARLIHAPDSAKTLAALRVRSERDLHAGQRDELRRRGLAHPAGNALRDRFGHAHRPADTSRHADVALHWRHHRS
jgi:hypothetical protein